MSISLVIVHLISVVDALISGTGVTQLTVGFEGEENVAFHFISYVIVPDFPDRIISYFPSLHVFEKTLVTMKVFLSSISEYDTKRININVSIHFILLSFVFFVFISKIEELSILLNVE